MRVALPALAVVMAGCIRESGGKEAHSFAIEGVAKLPAGLPPGNTAALTANLQPGT